MSCSPFIGYMKQKVKQNVVVNLDYDKIEALADKLREYTIGDPNFTAVDLAKWIGKSDMETRLILESLLSFCFVMHVKPKMVGLGHNMNLEIFRMLKPNERKPLLEARIQFIEQKKQGLEGLLKIMNIAKERLINKQKDEKNIS